MALGFSSLGLSFFRFPYLAAFSRFRSFRLPALLSSIAFGSIAFASLSCVLGLPELPSRAVLCCLNSALPRRVLRTENGLFSHLQESAQCGTSDFGQGVSHYN